jgi:3-oxoacyl-[acyl-carrier protein] reductase
MLNLKGKNVIVTGAASGIGRATAIILAKSQANLSLIDFNEKGLFAVEKKVKRYTDCAAFLCDVRCNKQVKDTMKEIGRYFNKKIDVLINNAGILKGGVINRCRPEDWINVVNTNLIGYFLCARYILPYMIKRKSGHIINNASYYGKKESANSSAYNATKSGILGFSKSMRLELKQFNIKVTTICESTTDTNLFKGTPWTPDPRTALRPEDIAGVIHQILTVRPGVVIEDIDITPLKYPYKR